MEQQCAGGQLGPLFALTFTVCSKSDCMTFIHKYHLLPFWESYQLSPLGGANEQVHFTLSGGLTLITTKAMNFNQDTGDLQCTSE